MRARDFEVGLKKYREAERKQENCNLKVYLLRKLQLLDTIKLLMVTMPGNS